MEIKAGYKTTEVGVIPNDWEVFQLDELIVKVGSGITPTGGANVYKADGRPLVRSQNIGWGKLLLDDIAFIDDETHQTFPNTEIKFNDVFLNISGASIGRSSYANEKLVGGNVNQHVCIIRVIDNKLNPVFLNLFLLSKNGQKQIDSFQSGGNRQGLNIGQIKTFQIPIPPTLTEQTAIANALSDADALITSLETLIAKKRNIKQGAMQKLLQPKEGWEVKRLGEICKIFGRIGFRGYTVNDIVKKEQGALSISPSNIQDDKMDFAQCTYISWFKYEESPEIKIFNGDILLVKTGSTSGKIAVVSNLNEKATINPQIVVLKKISVNNHFLGYIMAHKVIQNQIITTIVGGAIPTLSQKQIANFKISIPQTLSEQNRIASILSDMDNEITALENKLEKYKKIKLGMMQNLLTGRIRLI